MFDYYDYKIFLACGKTDPIYLFSMAVFLLMIYRLISIRENVYHVYVICLHAYL